MAITFSNPEYFLGLFIVPIIVLFHFISLKIRRKKALQFANFEAIARVKGVDIYSKNIFSTFLTIGILVLIIFTAAGPKTIVTQEVGKFSLVIALDVSRSMEANDISPNRLESAKIAAKDFVSSLPSGTKIGVVAFSGNSFIRQDITEDKQEVLKALNDIEISPLGGTDSYEAVITSTNLLVREPYKAIIFLSDGQSNVGNLDDAIEYASQNKVAIYSLGIGTEKGGETSYGFSKLDEDSLKSLSYNTQGEYYRIDNSTGLEDAFKTIGMKKQGQVSKDLSSLFLLLALILIVIEYAISAGFYKVFS